MRGKKRRDLINKENRNAVDDKFPIPLLWRAAMAGSLNILQYLTSEKVVAALRHYSATQSDERAKYLRGFPDFSKLVPRWLGWIPNALGESVLTAAIAGNKLDVLRYLVDLQRPYLKNALTSRYVSALVCKP